MNIKNKSTDINKKDLKINKVNNIIIKNYVNHYK